MAAPAVPIRASITSTVGAYVALTKPRIIELLLITTVPVMIVADQGVPSLWLIAATVIGGTLSAGGANAVNMWVDRDIDAVMERTQNRPLVTGAVTPTAALVFAIAIEAFAFLWLWVLVNPLSALLALAACLFYVFVYTLWLKRTSRQNIVIGGAAGAAPVLIGWAAVTDSVSISALALFGVVFFWTPPHFWALSLMIKDDYAKTGVPMLPVVKGEKATREAILIYTIFMVGFTVGPYCTGLLGPLYLAASVVLGLIYIGFSFALWRNPTPKITLQAYLYSLAYLALLFISMAVAAVAAA